MPLRFPRRFPYRYRYNPAHESPQRPLGPLARIRLDQRYSRVTGLPFLPALDLLHAQLAKYPRLAEHPLGRALLDAFQTAGRGGAHRDPAPLASRIRRGATSLVLLAMLATGPIPGTNLSVVAMDPVSVPPAARLADALATSRSADRDEPSDPAAEEAEKAEKAE